LIHEEFGGNALKVPVDEGVSGRVAFNSLVLLAAAFWE